jgi:type I restriction enzyme, S subunit
MEKYKICVPEARALEAFNDAAVPMFDRIVANIHESKVLAETRDLLLPKLMSGEVRVKDAEKIVREAP